MINQLLVIEEKLRCDPSETAEQISKLSIRVIDPPGEMQMRPFKKCGTKQYMIHQLLVIKDKWKCDPSKTAEQTSI